MNKLHAASLYRWTEEVCENCLFSFSLVKENTKHLHISDACRKSSLILRGSSAIRNISCRRKRNFIFNAGNWFSRFQRLVVVRSRELNEKTSTGTVINHTMWQSICFETKSFGMRDVRSILAVRFLSLFSIHRRFVLLCWLPTYGLAKVWYLSKLNRLGWSANKNACSDKRS